ncbi:MAG: hypothetical protein OJF55_000344 [Rhodanobacteraceae bacterium]|jgi:hypothetical protein|nr:MAG: hypothetical protein OJF55_000344 [Rhodanobacteraceae bacterium]
MNADEHMLYDLMATLNDHRRSLDSAALRSGDPARTAQCQRQSRAEAMTVAKITRDLARHGERHAPLSNRELNGYVDSLIDAYTDDSMDGFIAGGAIRKASLHGRNHAG